MAERETFPRLFVFCCFARLARFPRSRDHPEGLLVAIWLFFCAAVTSYYEESDRSHNSSQKPTKSMNSHQKTQELIKGKSPLFVLWKTKNKIFSVRRPRYQCQYFISDTKSQRSLITRHLLSCEKVNLHLVT